MKQPRFTLLALALAFLACARADAGPESLFPRPDPTDEAEMARWLAHVTDYGTLATLDSGKPYGGITSHSDGKLKLPTGRLFFYKSPMAELTQNVAHNPEVTFTVTEAQLPGGCKGGEPEEPTCAKVTFVGKFLPVDTKDDAMARAAMFDRHPKMASWPKDHQFAMYELQIEEIHLLAFFGGMKRVAPKDYYDAQLQQTAAAAPQGNEVHWHAAGMSTEQSSNAGGNISSGGSASFASVWFGAMAGAMFGVLLLAVGALGYKMHAEKQQRAYMPASSVVVDK